MKSLTSFAVFALCVTACSAKGTQTPSDSDAATDVAQPDVAQPDITQPDVAQPDVAQPDITQPDVAQPDVTVDATPDVSDVAPTRCTRDLDCTGVTFCSPEGVCVPLLCTPGRVMCVSPARAQVCDGRGATFTEVDCPGGCVLNNCMGATMTCPSPRVMCGSACVDVQTTAAHCGRCGNACATGQNCVAGACVTPCAAPRTVCGGACVDLQTTATNCGRCDVACAAGQTCVAGVCTTPCAAPRLVCGGVCTDVQVSMANCGRCGNSCPSSQTCVAGVCTTPCTSPNVMCGSICADVRTSTAHCGRCDNACATGQTCVAGVCTTPCTSPSLVCGGVCTDVRTSATNCGACGNACASGQTCVAGVCTTPCVSPNITCGGLCVDPRTSTTNCGGCGNACPSGQACTAGVCARVTTSGFRVLTLSNTGCQTVEHNAETGDDRGGIAIAGDRLFYNADTRFGSWQANDLSSFASLSGPHDGMVSDLATNTVYSAVDASGMEFPGSTAAAVTPFTITHLVALDPSTATFTATRITLSTPVTVTHDVGFLSGHGFVLIYSGVTSGTFTPRWYRVDLPSGTVTTTMSSSGFSHHMCENGGWYGVAERQGTDYYAVAVRNNMSIARTHLGDNVQTVISSFTDLADICSITVSPSRGRWYFHFEGASEIAPMGVETTGYCSATFATVP